MALRTSQFVRFASIGLASAALLFTVACSMNGTENKTAAPAEVAAQQQANIVATASAAGQFKTLLAAAQAAGLADTLSNDGPFTVFAPTDAAFAKLPAGTVEGLLEDTETLKKILLHHVVAGRAMAGDVLAKSSHTTLAGTSLPVKQSGGKAMIGEATIVTTDVVASNGVIHVIDTVLLPK